MVVRAKVAVNEARDGRAERGERTREAVVDAMLSLIEEGEARPTAPRIAERAGVALRTVFHHFEDMEALFTIAAERQTARVMALTQIVRRTGPLDARLDAFVAGRARLLEAITPVRRFAVLHEAASPEIATRLRWVRGRGRREVERVFEIELKQHSPAARRELLEAATVASSWSSWEALRAHEGLSPAQARRVMRRTLAALLKEND